MPLLGTIAGAAIDAGLGLALQNHNDKRQIRQQQKLQDQQEAANKRIADHNMANSLKMWEATNYAAQKEQMKKAGLNPGLLYGMGGGGGATTAGAGTASGVSGASAPQGGGEVMGMMMQRMQLEMMEKQKENIEADTENKKAENPNIPKTGEAIDQGIMNAKAQEILTKVQTEIAKQLQDYNPMMLSNIIDKGSNEIVQAQIQNDISNATKEAVIQKIKTEAANAIIQGEAMKAGIKLTEEQIKKIGADIMQRGQEIDIHRFKAEIDANNPSMSEITGNMLNSIKAQIQKLGGMSKDYTRPNQVNK